MAGASDFRLLNGIYVSEDAARKHRDFESHYLKVRKKEQRVLGIEEIKRLPDTATDYIHHREWEIRKKNIRRYLNYLAKKKSPLRILDVGCGNGFFSNKIASLGHRVTAVDVNLPELLQAKEAFPNPNLSWYYSDVLNESPGDGIFDQITFCCSFQYFSNPVALLDRCLAMLREGGEIHIIDSPFYNRHSRSLAAKRSEKHFEALQVPEMSAHYYHNSMELFSSFHFRYGYNPKGLFRKLFTRNDSPFPWIIVKK